jgi:hypothetical protein
VQRFLDEVISVRKLAWATVNVYFSAYRFLYTQVLKRPDRRFSIPRRGRSRRRPGVLSREEVRRLIAAPRNVKHRALLGMAYGSGLRVSEVVRVKIADIDRGRMMLRVEQGKGHRDRYTVLSSPALKLLEELWRRERPKTFFFTGQDGVRPICDGTAQAVYCAALRKSGMRRVRSGPLKRGCHHTDHVWPPHGLESRAAAAYLPAGRESVHRHPSLIASGLRTKFPELPHGVEAARQSDRIRRLESRSCSTKSPKRTRIRNAELQKLALKSQQPPRNARGQLHAVVFSASRSWLLGQVRSAGFKTSPPRRGVCIRWLHVRCSRHRMLDL